MASDGTSTTQPQTIDLGIRFPLSRFELQRGWKPVLSQNTDSLWISQEYAPIDADTVRLAFFHRGYSCSISSGNAFRHLLEKPTPSECFSGILMEIQEILREAILPGAFEFSSAKTCKLNSHTALLVQGQWSVTDLKMYWMLLPSNQDYTSIAEIFFEADEPNYGLYLQDAITMIESAV